MSSRTKRQKKWVAESERATFRRFADFVNVCPFGLRFKIAIKIICKKL